MTDKNSSPHIAALQELEAALDVHRRTQATAGAPERAAADAPSADSRLGRRRFSFGWPAWFQTWGRLPRWRLLRRKIGRLPIKPEILNPAILIDRKRPWLRKLTFTAAGAGRGGSDRRRRPVVAAAQRADLARHRDALAHLRGRAQFRQPLSHRSRRHAARARRPGADGAQASRHRAARHVGGFGRGRAQGRHRTVRRELSDRQPARPKLPAGRCELDDADRPGRTGQRHPRRREAVQRDCAHPGAAGHDARSGQSGAIIVAACRNACAGPRGSCPFFCAVFRASDASRANEPGRAGQTGRILVPVAGRARSCRQFFCAGRVDRQARRARSRRLRRFRWAGA